MFGDEHGTSLFHIDTQKNLIDYLERLQIIPKSVTRMPEDSHGRQSVAQRLRHLIFPFLYFVSWLTSLWAVYLILATSRSIGLRFFSMACVAIQTPF